MHWRRCMFVEHKPLQVSEFRSITLEEADRIIGHKGQAGSAAAGGVVNHTTRRLESRRWAMSTHLGEAGQKAHSLTCTCRRTRTLAHTHAHTHTLTFTHTHTRARVQMHLNADTHMHKARSGNACLAQQAWGLFGRCFCVGKDQSAVVLSGQQQNRSYRLIQPSCLTSSSCWVDVAWKWVGGRSICTDVWTVVQRLPAWHLAHTQP